LRLKPPDVFENTLGNNDVKLPRVKLDWGCKKVRLKQVWSWIVYCYIDPVVVYIFVNKPRQRLRFAPLLRAGNEAGHISDSL
jgi:hypothetical protein